MQVLGYYANGGNRIFEHVGFDDNNDYLFKSLLEEREKGFSVRRCDVESQWKKVENFSIDQLGPLHTCGRRMSEFGPWQRKENIDYYEKRDSYDACSFCGSAKFELLKEVIDKVNAGATGYTIEWASGKNYKIYLGTPDNSQIKFYTPHIPKEIFENQEQLTELNNKLKEACKKSWATFEQRWKDRTGNK
jgi:hypothetical protein